MKEYLAKSNSKTTLIEHLVSVGEMSEWMAKQVSNNSDKDYIAAAYICGILHDCGKMVNKFQEYLKDGTTEHPQHNLVSAFLVNSIYQGIFIDSMNIMSDVLSVIKYHHPINNDNDKDFDVTKIEDDFDGAYDFLKELKENIEKKCKEIGVDVRIIMPEKEKVRDEFSICSIKDITYLSNSARRFFLRNILTPADNIVSRCEHTNKNREDVFNWLMYRNENTNYSTFNIPEGYDSRFDTQLGYVKAMRNNGNAIDVFASETGFGKTMLGIMYLLMNNKKRGYWICPNNSIAKNSYETILRELKNLNLPHEVTVDLLLGNEYLGNGNGDKSDIIVTNIDNFFRPVIKSDATKLNNAFQILFGNCVFDEFHSYMSKCAIMSAFMLICRTRKYYAPNGTKTLLLSATPSSYALEQLGYKPDDIIYHRNEKVLDKKVKLIFADNMPTNLKGTNTFVCLHSRNYCQKVYSDGIVDDIYHAAYLDSYKTKIYQNLKTTHGDKKNIDNGSWAVTSIATTGLDISFQNGIYSNIYPSMFLQGLGRIDRWHNLKEIPEITILRNSDKSEKSAVRTFTPGKLAIKFKDFNAVSEMYISYLEVRFSHMSEVTIGDIYDVTKAFEEENKKDLYGFYDGIYNESLKNLRKIQYSYCVGKVENNTVTRISSKTNLRTTEEADNVFVILKDYETKNFIEELYQIDSSELDFNDSIWKEALKRTLGSYNLNQHQRKSMKKYNTSKIREYMISKAKCSDKPIRIPDGLYHDSKIGLIKID